MIGYKIGSSMAGAKTSPMENSSMNGNNDMDANMATLFVTGIL